LNTQLLEEHVDQKIDTCPLDLVVFQIVHDCDRHSNVLAGRWNPRELAGMRSDNVAFDRRLPIRGD